MLCSHQFDVFHVPDLESNSWLIHILPAASAQPKGAPRCEHRAGSGFLFMGDVIEHVPHRVFRGVSKHQVYSKSRSGNDTKLRLANSKACKQFHSSAFFHIPRLQSSTSGQAASALFYLKTQPSSTRGLFLRISITCQVMQGLLPAPQSGDKVIQINLTRSLFICSTENIQATPKDLRFQQKVINYNPFCFCYMYFSSSTIKVPINQFLPFFWPIPCFQTQMHHFVMPI